MFFVAFRLAGKEEAYAKKIVNVFHYFIE